MCCTAADLGEVETVDQEIQAEAVETVEQYVQAEDTAQGWSASHDLCSPHLHEISMNII